MDRNGVASYAGKVVKRARSCYSRYHDTENVNELYSCFTIKTKLDKYRY